MPSTYSPNKNYNLMQTGEDLNTWGINTNANLSLIDENLGGTLNISVAGNSNVTLTLTQAASLIHNLTGVLTGNINYIFPANGGFYAINNQTTGAYTITVMVTGGSGGVVVPQGTTTTLYVDASVPSVDGFTGTQPQFIAASVGGTVNAITVPSTIPANFSLNVGTQVYLFATGTNSSSVTLNVAGTGTIAVKKNSPSGLINLTTGDLASGIPLLALYNGTVWISLGSSYQGTVQSVSTAQSISFPALFNEYVATGACTFTISKTSTTLSPYWYIDIDCLGGAVTITPNAADTINVAGGTLSMGSSYTMPQGSSGRLYTDAAGNLFIRFYGIPYVVPGTSGNVLTSNGTSWTSAAVSGGITLYQVTDSTDITLSTAPTQSSIGSTKSINIPTNGMIHLYFSGELIASGSAPNGLVLGIRIGSTNYFATSASGVYLTAALPGTTGTFVYTGWGIDPGLTSNGTGGPSFVGLSIEGLSIPTGTQTVQVIVAKSSSNGLIVKGTVIQSIINIIVYNT